MFVKRLNPVHPLSWVTSLHAQEQPSDLELCCEYVIANVL